MIGRTVTRSDGAQFVVSGIDGDSFVLSPLEFGPVECVPGAVLAASFDVDAVEIPDADEQAGWAVLAERSRQLAAAPRDAATAPTPEERFAADAEAADDE